MQNLHCRTCTATSRARDSRSPWYVRILVRSNVFLAFLILAACGNDPATMCPPFTELKLPSITRLDRCDGNDLTGETTAKPEAFAAAFGAAGYEMGRDTNEPKYTKDWMYFRRKDDVFMMSSKFERSENRESPFFYIKRDKPRKWLPEATWQAVLTFPGERDKLLASYRGIADIFTAEARAPKQCPPIADDAMTSSPTLLVNLDSSDLAGNKQHRFKRGPELFAKGPPAEYESFDENVARRAELDTLRPRRIVPVMRVTTFKDPVVPGLNVTGTFTPGSAAFEIGVVDLAEKRVLCRSRGKAANSETIEATTTTYKRPDGSVESMSTSAPAHEDLAKNMRRVAFAELAKMSPAFKAP